MKLVELNPAWEKHGEYTHLAFDCPICKTHRIEIPVPPHPKAWGLSGTSFDEVTLSPSIAYETHYADGMEMQARHCKSHFFVRGGAIQIA